MEVVMRKTSAYSYDEARPVAHNDRGLASEERERLLRTNKKIKSVFGTIPPSSFLQMADRESQFVDSLRAERGGEDASDIITEGTNITAEYLSTGAECSASLASSCVPPLNLRRKQHRKSRSMAGLTLNYAEQGVFLPSPQDRPGPSRPSGLMRSQSHNASSRKAGVRPRPLPPLPRHTVEAESRVSTESTSTVSHSSIRRLPTPPLDPAESAQVEFPRYEGTHMSNSWPLDVPEDVSLNHLSLSTLKSDVSASEIIFSHEPTSPITSGSSSTTDVSSVRPPAKTPKVKPPIPPRPAPRSHASPYKFVQNSYSTTSLSSQISVPPMPPPAEIRKRNRDKMAKLMRVLGDSPPPHMVFSSAQGRVLHGVTVETEPAIYEESDMGHSEMSHASSSKAEDGYILVARGEQEKGKGKSSPIAHIIDFGSRGRSKSPAHARQPNRLRARSKPEDRRAVSMHVDTGTSSKLNFKVKGKTGIADVTASVEVANIDVPDIRTRERVPSKQWLLEIGPNKREVQTYDNVVKSLRML